MGWDVVMRLLEVLGFCGRPNPSAAADFGAP